MSSIIGGIVFLVLVTLPILMVLMVIDSVFFDYMIIDWILDISQRRRRKIESKKKKTKAKKEEALKLRLPSEAYQQGYIDMVNGLVGWHVPKGSFDFTKVERPYLSKEDMQEIAKRGRTLMAFDPERGRMSYKYLRGSNEEWQQYYAGGVRFLSDLEEERAVVAEGNRLAEIRRTGAKEMDRSIMTSIRELEKIRNQAFAVADDHAEFDKQMKEIK